MKLIPYLFFDGECRVAFEFYAECLRGKIEMVSKAGDAPGGESMPAAARERIMHVRLAVGGQTLMGSDWMADRPFERPQGFSVSLDVESVAEAERIFAAFAEDGTVRMPLEKTFFAERFGMLVDRFGISWMINCDNQT
ncbi:MAG: VOC family protein [Rhodanobacteraceae bacterium]